MVFITPRRTGGRPSRDYHGLPFAAPGVGDWLEARLADEPWLFRVIPDGFEAYARVFHPAYREVRDGEQPTMFAPNTLSAKADGELAMIYAREVWWAEVAAANGRIAHSAMEWTAITGDWGYRDGTMEQPGLWETGPTRGKLDQWPTIHLCELLSRFTSTASQCCFGVSVVYGDVPDHVRQGAPLVAETHVVTGPLNALADTSFEAHRHRSPNLWWPADHAWCVVSNIDLQVTHVAATQCCINALVQDPSLEALQIDPAKPTTDDINPEPSGTYDG
jgi:hypothetical protein